MLESLYIKNFVLVDELNIRFTGGLNIITGETGAGKSILVNAIGQLCGERSNSDLVRSGATKAIIEAQLHLRSSAVLNSLKQQLQIAEPDQDNIIIRKEISAGGGSRIFINDSPSTLAQLTELSSALFDLHGQHQHQRLLNPENHLAYLDDFAALSGALSEFKQAYIQYKAAVKSRDELKSRQKQATQMHDMYRYQYNELSSAQLESEEYEHLRSEEKRLSNIETLHESGAALIDALYSGEMNAAIILKRAEGYLARISEFDPRFSDLMNSLSDARQAAEEIGRFTQSYLDGLQFDPERFEQVQLRLAQLEFLLKKYQRLSIQELIALRDEMAEIINNVDQFDEQLARIEKEIAAAGSATTKAGSELTEKRIQAARIFEQRITTAIQDLGMPDASFTVDHSINENPAGVFESNGRKIQARPDGFDQITFNIASNPGESFKPLHKIASGGEISRVMLAIKGVLAQADHVPALIFDEIDAGISGKIAQIVGVKLAELARFHQILCVTHLPQIAAFAESHFKVSKFIEDRRTFVDISVLDEQAKVDEVALLLGGQDISKQAIENARHLIAEAKGLQPS
jgi:DNA repair protein RecN (Recombination protein N)